MQAYELKIVFNVDDNQNVYDNMVVKTFLKYIVNMQNVEQWDCTRNHEIQFLKID
jgi:hypothetical protein